MTEEEEFNRLPREAQEEVLMMDDMRASGAFDFLYERHSNEGVECHKVTFDPMENAEQWQATFRSAFA